MEIKNLREVRFIWMEEKYRNDVSDSVTMLFVRYGKDLESNEMNIARKQIMVEDLLRTGLNPAKINELINNAVTRCKFLPTLADILEPHRS